MSVKQFKFVSPGVFINEIDNSALNKVSDAIGPTVIGRLERGPALRPVKVKSYSEFVNIFGEAIPGGDSKDVWRNGNYTAPTYAAYAAQAYLRNSSPVNVVRLLGDENPNATSAGKAGWKSNEAYGLYITPSSSTPQFQTGTLAAIWYVESGTTIRLTGSTLANTATASVATFVKNVGTDFGFKAQIVTNSSVAYTTEFNFNEASDKFIRKVFNTNPTLINSDVGNTSVSGTYWLGESYENWLGNTDAGHDVTDATAAEGQLIGAIFKLESTANKQQEHQKKFRSAQTDFVIAQDLSNDTGSFQVSTGRTPNLFRFVAIDAGLNESQNFKISIEEIRESTTDSQPYGSFTVVLRRAKDSDNSIQFIERYTQCNLDPKSENYIARKIGDKYIDWDYSEGRYREYGRFNNQSSFIRIEMDNNVDAGVTDERLLPAGFRGPVKLQDIFLKASYSGKNPDFAPKQTGVLDSGSIRIDIGFPGGLAIATPVPIAADQNAEGNFGLDLLSSSFAAPGTGITASFIHPGHMPRVDSTSAPAATRAYFGYTTSKSNASTAYSLKNLDFARSMCDGLYDSQFNDSTSVFASGSAIKRSFIFTLDDLSGSAGYNDVNKTPPIMYWSSGSRAGALSYRGTASFGAMLRKGFNKFSLPMYGGNDGLKITEMEPFRNSAIGTTDSATTNYAMQTIQRAIDTVSDPEVVDTNMITMPGLTHQGLITRIIRTCEDRADALAIVDLKGGYQPNTEAVGNEQARRGSLDSVISNLQTLQENSSYACAYYPWVQIRDPEKGALVWVPPSVAAIGVFSTTERKDELWFAPAGFNRGGLSNGDAGLPVVGTSQRLTSKERDNLYEANINPIANFPNEGIVVFGQKTLQITPSALDRINVRRLMNFVKKEISRMAGQVLFQPNVKQTWNGFLSKVNPFLSTVQSRFGLDDFKVVLDETTTTPELIDRNIVYAKIFLKPTKAIEYIAIDFNITNSGASFED
jgi:phage tail sheath protein FI